MDSAAVAGTVNNMFTRLDLEKVNPSVFKLTAELIAHCPGLTPMLLCKLLEFTHGLHRDDVIIALKVLRESGWVRVTRAVRLHRV